MNATTAMNTRHAVSVAGSVGFTLKSCACSSRVRPNDGDEAGDEADDRQPHPLPEDHAEHAAARGAERHVDADLLAPLADRVRQDAVGADRRERAARAPAKMPSSCARNRGRDTDAPNTSSIVRSLTIGSVGSIDCTHALRICGASASTGSDVRTTTFMLPRRERRAARPLLGRK